MTEKETKRNLQISLSSYASHKKEDVSLDEWFNVQNIKRNDQTFKKKYQHLIGRK